MDSQCGERRGSDAMDATERTRLRALCERAALPACEARLLRDDGAWCVVVPQGESFCAVIAELSWSGIEPFGGGAVTEARTKLYAEAPAAILALLDALEAREAERDAALEECDTLRRGRDHGDSVIDETCAILGAAADEGAVVAAQRVTAERDDLRAVLETRDAEHAMLRARVAELEAGRTEAVAAARREGAAAMRDACAAVVIAERDDVPRPGATTSWVDQSWRREVKRLAAAADAIRDLPLPGEVSR